MTDLKKLYQSELPSRAIAVFLMVEERFRWNKADSSNYYILDNTSG